MAYISTNPTTAQTVKEYDFHSEDEVEHLLVLADAAFRDPSWRDDLDRRTAVLERLAVIFSERADEIAEIMALEMGKPIAQGRDEAALCAEIASYYAKNGQKMLAPVPYSSHAGKAWVEHHPIGVIIAVEPWNYPMYQLIRVVAPAIVVGNSILFKHAGIVPGCAALFEQLVDEAGAIKGAISNLFVPPEQISTLLADDRVQGVTVTGSERAGSVVAAEAAKALKKSTLELGGSDVFIVLDDADIEKAAKTGAASRLYNAGQVCVAAKRFIVQRSVAEAFVTELSSEFSNAVLGDPLDLRTTIGPLSSKAALRTLVSQVEAAVEHGAELLLGGKAVDREGFFFEPGILTNITPENPAYHQEFFGPVAQIYVVDTEDEAVHIANDTQFGLGGAIFSSNIDRASALASRIETGMVFINSMTRSYPELPFGGIKRSGFGRELSDLGLLEFVNKKLVVVG